MSELLLKAASIWWSWIPPLAVQGALLILLVAAIDQLLPRRTWPQLRAALWTLALLKLCLPPSLTSPLSLLHWAPSSLVGAWQVLGPEPFEAHKDPAVLSAWATTLFLSWTAGLCLLSVVGFGRYRRQKRRWRASAIDPRGTWLPTLMDSAAHRLGLRRPVPIFLQSALNAPFVIGVWNPQVHLPADLEPEEAEHVLLHELAHVARRDTWRAAAATAVQLLYWFHPLVWWARSRFGAACEQCCDRSVARALGADSPAYRQTLLRFASRRLALSRGGLGFVRPRSALLLRLALLERPFAERVWLKRWVTTAVTIALLVACIPMAVRAESAVAAIGEAIDRPPGCLQIRYLVLQKLAQERGFLDSPDDASPESPRGDRHELSTP